MRALVSLLAVLVLGSCSAPPRAPHPSDSFPAPPTSGTDLGSPGHSPASTTPSNQVTHVTATTLPVRLPAPASRVVAVAAGGHVLMLGGLVAGTTSAQVLRLDPAAAKITAAGRLAHATHDAGGAVLGGSVFVFGGGVQASADWVQSVPVAGGSGALVGHLPTPRSDHVVASNGTTAYVVGGYATGPGLTDVLATTNGTTFHIVAHLVTGVRYAAAALVGGALWVVGGERDGAQVDTVQRVDLATGAASVVGHLAAPLSHATATVLDGTLLVVGGLSAGKHLDAIERLDTATGATSLVGHLPTAASDTAVAVLGDAAYVIGGETSAAGSTHPLDTVVRLTTGPASAAP
jgi:N-acetylneuraminic acid mutarotase